MYTKKVPYKDFNGNPRNETVCLNLMETEVFKLMGELKLIANWRQSIQSDDIMELDTAEVVEFYTALENVLLAAYGVPKDDGRRFDKSGRYEFAESALFNAIMLMFVTDPSEATKMIDELMPKGLNELVQKADDNLIELAKNSSNNSDLQRQVEDLRAQLAAQTGGSQPTS